MTHNNHFMPRSNRGELYAVPDLPDQDTTYSVPERRKRLDLAHLQSLGSLPCNVFKIRPEAEPEPPDIAA